MNIKPMLIEKERLAYIAGDTALAEFFDATLQYLIDLEGQVNEKDAEIERLDEVLADMKKRVQEIVGDD